MYMHFSQDVVLSFPKDFSSFCHDVIRVQPPPERKGVGVGGLPVL